jgi:hypothetical protein
MDARIKKAQNYVIQYYTLHLPQKFGAQCFVNAAHPLITHTFCMC